MITANRLAWRYDLSLSPLRPSHDRVAGFDRWLGAFWTATCPPEPDSCPDAVSRLDDLGERAIRWYDQEDEVLGFFSGIPAHCYRVPADEPEPSLDDLLDEDGPVCDGDDHAVRDRVDTLLAVIPITGHYGNGADHSTDQRVEPAPDLRGRSGRDWLPAGDLFHRQAEGDRQIVG